MSQNLAVVPLPSASTIAATATTGGHILKISGYSQAKLLVNTGSCIESAKFEVAGHSWRIMVFPNGTNEESASYMSLVLDLASEEDGSSEPHLARAKFAFSFVRQDIKLKAKPNVPGGLHTFFKCDVAYPDVAMRVKREKLERPEYLKDDTILIRCDVTVLNEPVVQLQDVATLELLCDCRDDQCKNIHKESSSRNLKNLSHDVVPSPSAPFPSASAIVVSSRTGCHIVQISGYSRTKLLFENGKHVSSAEFTEAGHTWRIRCYPNGYNQESSGYMSLFLHLADESRNVRTNFHLSLVPQGKLTDMPDGGKSQKRITIRSNSQGWGFKYFMQIETLENSEYLKDDSLFVRCDITVLKTTITAGHDLEALQLLCDCKDDLCKNLHAIDNKETATKPPSKFSSQVLKNMLLRCLTNPSAIV